jgi:DNA-binding transcriptional ArsR family regulator
MKDRYTEAAASQASSDELSALFKAIGDPTRVRILIMLEGRELSVSEIVNHFRLSQPTISRHLSVLRQAGLVSRRRTGQRVVYSLRPESVKCCCEDFFGSFECCSPLFARRRGSGRGRRP